MKRGAVALGADAPNGPDKKRYPVSRCCMKALMPDYMVKQLIGPRGSNKDAIQEETGTRLIFSNQNDYFPGSQHRVLAIYGEEIWRIISVFHKVVEMLVKLGEEERANGTSVPEYTGKERGEYLLRLAISKSVAGALIGQGGGRIKELRQECGAKLFIENELVAGHLMMRVIGEPDRIHHALDCIGEAHETEAGKELHKDWAQLVNFSEAQGEQEQHTRKDAGQNYQDWDRADQKATWGSSELDSDPVDSLVAAVADTIGEMIPGTADVSYSISFKHLSSYVGKMLEDHDFVSHVEQTCFVQLSSDHEPTNSIEDDSAAQESQITLVGSLISIYTAHLMILKRIKDEEAAANYVEEDPAVLRAQIEELKAQLAASQGASYQSGGKKAGGKGKKSKN